MNALLGRTQYSHSILENQRRKKSKVTIGFKILSNKLKIITVMSKKVGNKEMMRMKII